MKDKLHHSINTSIEGESIKSADSDWINDLALLVKFRVNLLVVITSILAALIAGVGESVDLLTYFLLGAGGFLITGASSVFNEILEKKYDAKMSRTANRPLPAGRMSQNTAVLIGGAFALVGIAFLAMINVQAGVIGALAMVIYSFIYTPLKRVTPYATHVGAIPGALPVVIGVVAIEGGITDLAIILFTIQFFWQFGHFWSIAWLSHDDYTRGGYRLLPSKGNKKNKEVGFYATLYTAALIPTTILLILLSETNIIAIGVVVLLSCYYLYQAISFYRGANDSTARNLKLGSLAYLPLVLILIYIGQLI